MRIELAERMVQFPQHLADKLTHLAEWMVCGNALLRPDIREHSALIEKSSAHRKSSRRISGKSESPHVRSGEVFQQTARAFRGKLEHCCFLTFEHVSEKHNLLVRKFQCIMMCSRVVLVDLPEDGSPVIDCIRFPAKPSVLATPHFLGKGEFRSRKNTNCYLDIFRRSKPSSAGVEVVGGQFVPDLGRT